MDAIDITSAEFSLGKVQEAVSSTVDVFNLNDYIIYIYIVLGIIAFVIAFLIYKYYSSNYFYSSGNWRKCYIYCFGI
jgi:hypothetical protein